MRTILSYSCLFFCSFSFVFPNNCFAKKANSKKQNIEAFKTELHQHINNQDFVKASDLILKERKKGMPLTVMARAVKMEEAPPLYTAFKAMKNINELKEKTALSRDDLLQLSLFIETKLAKAVKKKGNYLKRKSTNLARTIEYDPETKKTFIHLGNHGGVGRIGKGSKKIVTKSVLYDKKNPEIVANCTTFKAIPLEVTAVKALKGVKGLLEVRALTKRKGRNNTPIYSFFCKYYKEGTILNVLKNHKLSLRQRMHLARDILTGISGMHGRGYVHRDLGLANYLADSKKQGTTKGLHAVVADFGRSMKAKDAAGKNTQGHAKYTPPEGLLRRRAKLNYYAADVYAVGCLLYRLFYQSKAPWLDLALIKDHSLSAKQRYKTYHKRLQSYHTKESSRLRSKIRKKKQDALLRMKELTMQLVHPNPKKRLKAGDAQKKCQEILRKASR